MLTNKATSSRDALNLMILFLSVSPASWYFFCDSETKLFATRPNILSKNYQNRQPTRLAGVFR